MNSRVFFSGLVFFLLGILLTMTPPREDIAFFFIMAGYSFLALGIFGIFAAILSKETIKS